MREETGREVMAEVERLQAILAAQVAQLATTQGEIEALEAQRDALSPSEAQVANNAGGASAGGDAQGGKPQEEDEEEDEPNVQDDMSTLFTTGAKTAKKKPQKPQGRPLLPWLGMIAAVIAGSFCVYMACIR